MSSKDIGCNSQSWGSNILEYSATQRMLPEDVSIRESVCWGVVGVPLIENEKDSRFLGFLVLKLLGFVVSKSQSFKVSKIRKFISWLLKDLGSILPHFHFMLSGRYWSHIQYFQHFIRWIVANLSNILDFRYFEMFQNNIGSTWFVFSWIVGCILGSPKINKNGVGSHGHVQKFRNHRNEFCGFSYNQIEKLLIKNEAE